MVVKMDGRTKDLSVSWLNESAKRHNMQIQTTTKKRPRVSLVYKRTRPNMTMPEKHNRLCHRSLIAGYGDEANQMVLDASYGLFVETARLQQMIRRTSMFRVSAEMILLSVRKRKEGYLLACSAFRDLSSSSCIL